MLLLKAHLNDSQHIVTNTLLILRIHEVSTHISAVLKPKLPSNGIGT